MGIIMENELRNALECKPDYDPDDKFGLYSFWVVGYFEGKEVGKVYFDYPFRIWRDTCQMEIDVDQWKHFQEKEK